MAEQKALDALLKNLPYEKRNYQIESNISLKKEKKWK